MKTPKNLLKKYHISPNKRLGQNFLIDKRVLAKIIQAADLSFDDAVLEIGPGLGVLTLELAKHAKKVIAVEKDKKMVEILKSVLKENNVKNVEIIEGNILKIDTSLCHPDPPAGGEGSRRDSESRHGGTQNDKTTPYKIIANIPYYLTSPLIRKFLESENQPKFMLLMLQKEVAQRICSKPPKMTLLSCAVQFYAEPKIISYVSKKSFFPQPKVDSAIIKMTPFGRHPKLVSGSRTKNTKMLKQVQHDKLNRDNFFRLVKAAFSQPRKQLINNLSKGLCLTRGQTEKILSKCGVKPTQRPSELSVDKYMELAWITYGE